MLDCFMIDLILNPAYSGCMTSIWLVIVRNVLENVFEDSCMCIVDLVHIKIGKNMTAGVPPSYGRIQNENETNMIGHRCVFRLRSAGRIHNGTRCGSRILKKYVGSEFEFDPDTNFCDDRDHAKTSVDITSSDRSRTELFISTWKKYFHVLCIAKVRNDRPLGNDLLYVAGHSHCSFIRFKLFRCRL